MNLRDDAPVRSVTDVGPGDYVKVGSHWERIEWNTAEGLRHPPRHWIVHTEHGSLTGMAINRYAKAEDLEGS